MSNPIVRLSRACMLLLLCWTTIPPGVALAQDDGTLLPVRQINLDGSPVLSPVSPVAIAGAVGGAILLVGGGLSWLLWRRASESD